MNNLWKLLRQNISVGQLAGFFISNLVGMVIILLSVQLYFDLRPVIAEGDSFMRNDYMVLSKEVTTVGTLLGKNLTFSDKEIENIAQQPFTKSVGEFTSSQFEIYVSLSLGEGTGRISSDIFFESVGDEYIDVATDEWLFDEQVGEIPIIVPRNYLNLYNFGFSQSRNYPKLSEGAIALISLDVNIRGNGKTERLKGRIIGFSDRLNTILVPERFMGWANDRFSDEVNVAPTRLILEVKNPSDRAIAEFFEQKKYVSENDKLDDSKVSFFMRFAIYIVLFIGLFISLLSLYILTLSIFLLLEKNSRKLENLLLIGYSTRQVARPYQLLTAAINGAICVMAIAIVIVIRGLYMPTIEVILPNGVAATMLPSVITALAVTGVVIFGNCWGIVFKVRS